MKNAKRYIEERIRYWLEDFGFLPSVVSIEFPKKNTETAHGGDAMFQVVAGYPYRQIEFFVFPCALNSTKEQIEGGIKHEMLHIAVAKMRFFRKASREVWIAVEEEVVDHLSFMIRD